MASLYELNNDYLALQSMIQEAETEDDIKALDDTIAAIADAIEVKGENYAKLIKSVEGENDTIDSEIKRLQAVKKRNKTLVDKLKANMNDTMKNRGVDKLKCGTFTFSYRKSTSVEIQDISKLADEFVKVEYSANKTAIKNAIKNGETVHGAVLVETMNLQLR